MKKTFLLAVLFLSIFSLFPKSAWGEKYCVEVGTRAGTLTSTKNYNLICQDSLSALQTNTKTIIDSNNSAWFKDNSIKSFVIEKDGVISRFDYQKRSDTNGNEVFNDINYAIGKKNPDLPPFCIADGTQVNCFNTRQECMDQISVAKTPNLKFQSCDGGIIKNRANENTDFNGNVIVPPVTKKCFFDGEGKEQCFDTIAACESSLNRFKATLDPEFPDGRTCGDRVGTDSQNDGGTPGGVNNDGGNPGRNKDGGNPGTKSEPVKFSVTLTNPLGKNVTNINQLIARLITIALDLGLIVASLAILYSGFLFVKAQGDSKKITEAKNRLQWSVIGLAILLSASIITQIVKSTIESLSK